MKKGYPKYSIKFKKNNKWGKVSTFWSSTRILKRLNLNKNEKAYVKVYYSPTEYNDGYYTDEKMLRLAWECFTDKDLIREYCPNFRFRRSTK